jgi:hypothetical protein
MMIITMITAQIAFPALLEHSVLPAPCSATDALPEQENLKIKHQTKPNVFPVKVVVIKIYLETTPASIAQLDGFKRYKEKNFVFRASPAKKVLHLASDAINVQKVTIRTNRNNPNVQKPVMGPSSWVAAPLRWKFLLVHSNNSVTTKA